MVAKKSGQELSSDIYPQQPSRGQSLVLPRTDLRVPGTLASVFGRTFLILFGHKSLPSQNVCIVFLKTPIYNKV